MGLFSLEGISGSSDYIDAHAYPGGKKTAWWLKMLLKAINSIKKSHRFVTIMNVILGFGRASFVEAHNSSIAAVGPVIDQTS